MLPSAYSGDELDDFGEPLTPSWSLLKSPRTATIIPAPMTFGQPFTGVDLGPSSMIEEGLPGQLSQLGWRIEKSPEVDFKSEGREAPGARNSEIVGGGALKVAEIVRSNAGKGRFPLTLGGDHSISIGTLAGMLSVYPDLGVIWVDAHADLNTPAMSGSGNMHGMPVGLCTEGMMNDDEYEGIPGLEWLAQEPFKNRLKPSNLVYVGLRDVDLPERATIKKKGIKYFSMYDIDRLGIGRVMEYAIRHLTSSNPSRPIHLSYDIDAIDPASAPATGTAVRGGLTYREAHFVAERTANSGNLVGADIVELNPNLSDEKGVAETTQMGLAVVRSFMGESII